MPDDIRLQQVAIHKPSMLTDAARFEFGQRVANLFANSQLVPAALRGKPADCFIALHMAEQMGEDPIMVMQNIYFVGAKAGWSAQYMVARAARSGKFRGPLRWQTEGAGDDLAVTCYGDLAGIDDPDEARVEVRVSLAQARAEGWTRNEKYKSIPEQMLRWRSATWLIRLYAPDVMMGLPTADELTDYGDMVDVTPARPQQARPRIEDADKPRARRDAAPTPAVSDIAPDQGEAHTNSPAGTVSPQEKGDQTLSAHQEPAGDTHEEGGSAGEISADHDEAAGIGIDMSIIDNDGEIIECGSIEELRQRWAEAFMLPMSPDQIVGMWQDNSGVRKLLYEAFGSAAMNESYDRYDRAKKEFALTQPGLFPGLGASPGAPDDQSLTLNIDPGWGAQKAANAFRDKLEWITNLEPALRKTSIERFRQVNGAIEIRLNSKLRAWMEQHVHPVYAQCGVRL